MVITADVVMSGRFLAAEGAVLPAFQRVAIMMRARLGAFIGWASPGAVAADATFTLKNLPSAPHDLSVVGLPGNYYVKEIRYNGVASPDGLVRVAKGIPNQSVEIVLDDKAGTINGSVHDGEKPASNPVIVMVKWPFSEGDVPLSRDGLVGDKDGRFQISGLAPGEYRVMALNKIVRVTELSNQLLMRAEKVTLERGSLKDVSLKLIDLSQ
jgi:hypothetical protein